MTGQAASDQAVPDQGGGKPLAGRVDWVDYGKGICIILVVMMHSTFRYSGLSGGEEGWMHEIVHFAKPLRLPDFFLIAGLFLSRSIHGPLISYVDRKVVHFAYFYVLWMVIQTGVLEVDLALGDPLAFVRLLAFQLVAPTSTLWFIHMLLIFYVVTRLTRTLPKWLVFAVAAGLHTAFYAGLFETVSWNVITHFVNWYVFFFAGYAFAPLVFRFADRVGRHAVPALVALAVWALLNWGAVAADIAFLPGISLLLGFAGAGAIVAIAALLARFDIGHAIRYAGRNSIVIYLTFAIPMMAMVKVFAVFGTLPDIGLGCLVVLVVSVSTPLLFHAVIRHTPLNFLYERPDFLRITKARRGPAKAAIATRTAE